MLCVVSLATVEMATSIAFDGDLTCDGGYGDVYGLSLCFVLCCQQQWGWLLESLLMVM